MKMLASLHSCYRVRKIRDKRFGSHMTFSWETAEKIHALLI